MGVMTVNAFLKQSLVDFALDTRNKKMLEQLARDEYPIVNPTASGLNQMKAKAHSDSKKAWEEAEKQKPLKMGGNKVHVDKATGEVVDDTNIVTLYASEIGYRMASKGMDDIYALNRVTGDFKVPFRVHVTDICSNGDHGLHRVKTKRIKWLKKAETEIVLIECDRCGVTDDIDPTVGHSDYYGKTICDSCYEAFADDELREKN